MVLAAGLGERMRPLTDVRAKAALPLLNRPIIMQTLSYLRRHGVDEAMINLHYQPDSIRGLVGDGQRLGLKVHYSDEQVILGTAGGLKKAEAVFRGGGTFIMINSDFVTDCDLGAAVAQHKKAAGVATMVLTPHRPGTAYGSVHLGQDGRVISIAGRPPLASVPAGLAFTGIHVLEPSLLDSIPAGVPFEINRDVYPLIIQRGGLINGYLHTGFWRELGTPRLYLEGSMITLAEMHDPVLQPLQQGDGIFLEQIRLPPSTTLSSPVLIGRGTSVGRNCSFLGGVVIGRQCRIANDCALRSCILWDGARLGDRVELTDCIVTSGVYVPPMTGLSGRILLRAEGYQGRKDQLERFGNCWAAKLL